MDRQASREAAIRWRLMVEGACGSFLFLLRLREPGFQCRKAVEPVDDAEAEERVVVAVESVVRRGDPLDEL